MSERHEVTVYDRVPATAVVSVEQIERYLERTGWTKEHWPFGYRGYGRDGVHNKPVVHDLDEGESLAGCVAKVARYENRQPSAVLADIAKEEPDHA